MSERVMALVRNLVLTTLAHNIIIKSEYIQGKLNVIADSLSRCDWQRFRWLCPTAINSLQIFQTTCGNFGRRSEFAIEIVFGF
jgi:hypothetical protein